MFYVMYNGARKKYLENSRGIWYSDDPEAAAQVLAACKAYMESMSLDASAIRLIETENLADLLH